MKAKLEEGDIIFQNQQWSDEANNLLNVFPNFHKEINSDFWNKLSPSQQQEIDEATAEIERGETTDYETFMTKHRT